MSEVHFMRAVRRAPQNLNTSPKDQQFDNHIFDKHNNIILYNSFTFFRFLL